MKRVTIVSLLKTISVLTFIIFSGSSLLLADEFSLGFGVGFQTSPYRGHDDQYAPAPFIHYEGENFYFRGLSAGAKLWNSDGHELSAGLSYDFHRFKSTDSDVWAMRLLNSRHPSVNATLAYALRGEYGALALSIQQDISGHSEGQTIDASYSYGFDLGQFHLRPGAGLQWESEKKLQYYYGISLNESLISGPT